MVRKRRARMLSKLLFLLSADAGWNFYDTVNLTVDIFSVNFGKNVNWELVKQQLKEDYNNLMNNGITDEMFS